ncbi:hypothetical protein P4O66_019708 [Electrophorus voltai]|uniref:Uncharacterized protein n=1 Tax=Electrophorus voltai TaxID=2609070 RepID=A0AAD8ZU39_9TELE|nr:hypothetical protein P4O66_019708 [Electrophorus voltai]
MTYWSKLRLLQEPGSQTSASSDASGQEEGTSQVMCNKTEA